MLGEVKIKAGKRLRALSVRTVDRVAGTAPVERWRTRRYDRAIAAHRSRLPSLDDRWAAIDRSLQDRGLHQTDLAALAVPDWQGMIAAGQTLIAEWQGRLTKEAQRGVEFLRVPPAAMMRHPEIYRFGLDPALLGLVETYIGLPVAYDGVALQFTVADGRAVSTRAWHRDREDRRMLKVAVYLNDVDAAGGPFELLPGCRDEAIRTASRNGFHLDAADLARASAQGMMPAPVSCEGPAGTVVFADTARFFHRGKPATGRDRAALFFSYFARVPKRPYFCARTGFSHADLAHLSKDLTPGQQAAALWHDSLPLHWRVVPVAEV